MKKSVISKLLTELEKHVQTEFETGVEFWLARVNRSFSRGQENDLLDMADAIRRHSSHFSLGTSHFS